MVSITQQKAAAPPGQSLQSPSHNPKRAARGTPLNKRMTIKMKIYVPAWAMALLFFLLFPLLSMAQLPHLRAGDSLKMDSMRKVIRRIDSIRVDSLRRDTTGAAVIRSRPELIYSVANTTSAGGQQLVVQVVRFRHRHYLNFKWQSAFPRQVSVGAGATLLLTFSDGGTAVLNANGAAAPISDGMRHSAELSVEYVLGRDDFDSLLNKTLTAVTLNYTGGAAVFNIGSAGAANIKKACLYVK
jgi:hypothetical protein